MGLPTRIDMVTEEEAEAVTAQLVALENRLATLKPWIKDTTDPDSHLVERFDELAAEAGELREHVMRLEGQQGRRISPGTRSANLMPSKAGHKCRCC